MSRGPPASAKHFGYGVGGEHDLILDEDATASATAAGAIQDAANAANSANMAGTAAGGAVMMYFPDDSALLSDFDANMQAFYDAGAADSAYLGQANVAPPPVSSVSPRSFLLPAGFRTDCAPDTHGVPSVPSVASVPSIPSVPSDIKNSSFNESTNNSSPDKDADGGMDDNDATGMDNSAVEPGAGPEPVADLSDNNSSSSLAGALTEFTRRKNWPAKVVEELCDLLQIIEPGGGRIRFASPAIVDVLGYTPEETIGEVLADLVHTDDQPVFQSELHACIANASMLRMYLRMRRKDGAYAVLETVGHAHIAAPRFGPNPSNQSAFCQAVFLMSRPYPTKNAGLLDSFLEHKMENERLRRRIDDLRREEEYESRGGDNSEAAWMQSQSQSQSQGLGLGQGQSQGSGQGQFSNRGMFWRQSLDGRSDLSPIEGPGAVPNAVFHVGDSSGLPPVTTSMGPPRMGSGGMGLVGVGSLQQQQQQQQMLMQSFHNHNAALTRENLEGIAARRPDSLHDKMARYEAIPGTAAGGSGGPSTTMPTLPAATTAPVTVPVPTPADTIEMLTGLRYQEGERSRGLSTGNRSPRLVQGDAGIAFSVNRERRAGEKKKKIRLVEEYVCTDCGTLQSPEWRKGPSGPKTLCNACGLRWAKKEKKDKKKAAGDAGSTGMAGPGSAGPGSAGQAGPDAAEGQSSPRLWE